jgi:hypothetical protein
MAQPWISPMARLLSPKRKSALNSLLVFGLRALAQ